MSVQTEPILSRSPSDDLDGVPLLAFSRCVLPTIASVITTCSHKVRTRSPWDPNVVAWPYHVFPAASAKSSVTAPTPHAIAVRREGLAAIMSLTPRSQTTLSLHRPMRARNFTENPRLLRGSKKPTTGTDAPRSMRMLERKTSPPLRPLPILDLKPTLYGISKKGSLSSKRL